MPCSADASGMRSSRFSSFSAWFSASSGMPALAIASRSSAISAWPSSPSPSSFWIWRSCSRRMCSRWRPDSDSLRLLADLLGQPQHLDLLGEVAQQLVEPFADVERLQQILLLGRREVRDIGDEVGQRRRRLNLLDGRGDLGRQVGQQRDRLAGALLQLVHARGDLGGKYLGLADLVDARHQERIARQEFEHAEAPYAAGHQMMIAVRRGDITQDFAHGADAMEMLGARRLDRGVALQQHADRLVRLRRGLGAGDRLLAAERERHHDAGEQHGIAGRQDDQRAGGKLGVRGGPARRTRRSGRLLVASGLRALRPIAAWHVRYRSYLLHQTPGSQLGKSEHETAVT